MNLFMDWARTWLRLIFRAGYAVTAPDSALIAASIGYFALFSLFPLILLTVAIASFWLDPQIAESEIVTQLEFVAPALGDLLGANLEEIIRTRAQVTGISVLVFLWASSNIFSVLTRAMNRVWHVQIRPAWRHRGLALLTVIVISMTLLVAVFVGQTAITIIITLVPAQLESLLPYTAQFWNILVSIILFGSLYYFLPHRELPWRDILPGAIVAGVTWDLAKRLFLSFISLYFSRSNLLYGSVATIIAFLSWTYISGLLFLFGGYLNVEYAVHKGDLQGVDNNNENLLRVLPSANNEGQNKSEGHTDEVSSEVIPTK